MIHARTTLSAMFALAVATVACGGSQEPQAQAPSNKAEQGTPVGTNQYGTAMGQGNTPAPDPNTQTQATAPETPPLTGAQGAPSVAGSTTSTNLDDAQMAAIVMAIHSGEIQSAQLATTKASSPAVKRFARDMLNQHRDMERRAKAVVARLQLVASDNAISTQSKADAQSELSTLQARRGTDFDHDYVNAQVRDHNRALELIDRMMTDAKNTEFKAELQSERTTVEAQLRSAEQLQKSFDRPYGSDQ